MQSFDAYEPCGSCHRHVKRQDAACPFCGAARTPRLPSMPRRTRNVSRAQWLAFGSAVVGLGCNGVLGSNRAAEVSEGASDGAPASTAPAASADGVHDANLTDDAMLADDPSPADETIPPNSPREDAQDPMAEAAPEAGVSPWGPPDASCPRSGTFACGSVRCDRATQYCSHSTTCEPYANLTNEVPFVDGGTCGGCATCACIPPGTYATRSCTCFEDNFGGLTVSCSQSGCYGSPPARLDRAPLSRSAALRV